MGCMLCPRECNIDRNIQPGYCGETSTLRVARAALHLWEEPCICGKAGSGTVFFTGCPLHCVFCQNNSISENSLHTPNASANGETDSHSIKKEITPDRLAEIFLELQEKNACNINLVTPTHFIHQIIPAIKKARSEGLSIPLVYNTGGYEKVESLRALEGLIDIYLPDLKYVSSRLSARYSNAPDYFEYASLAIAEMVRQTGPATFDEETGLMKKGVIVRHMMLPKHLQDSKKVVSHLYETYKNDICVSIMNQYTPMQTFTEFSELNRRVSHKEYNALIDYCIMLGIENGFIQEGEAARSSFIPSFRGEGV